MRDFSGGKRREREKQKSGLGNPGGVFQKLPWAICRGFSSNVDVFRGECEVDSWREKLYVYMENQNT